MHPFAEQNFDLRTADPKRHPNALDFEAKGIRFQCSRAILLHCLDGRPRRTLTPQQRAMWDAVYEPKNAALAAANLRGRDLPRWKYQRYIKDYLRCIASVDDSVGRVLRYLDASGLADNTVVIY